MVNDVLPSPPQEDPVNHILELVDMSLGRLHLGKSRQDHGSREFARQILVPILNGVFCP